MHDGSHDKGPWSHKFSLGGRERHQILACVYVHVYDLGGVRLQVRLSVKRGHHDGSPAGIDITYMPMSRFGRLGRPTTLCCLPDSKAPVMQIARELSGTSYGCARRAGDTEQVRTNILDMTPAQLTKSSKHLMTAGTHVVPHSTHMMAACPTMHSIYPSTIYTLITLGATDRNPP